MTAQLSSPLQSPLRIACIQYAAKDDVAANLAIISALMTTAKSQGAEMVQLPEMANLMQPDKIQARESLNAFKTSLFLEALQELALHHQLWIHVGSLIVPKKTYFRNRGYLINAAGEIVGQYDKIHLFDVDFLKGETYRESDHYRPGNLGVVLPTPWGNLGLAICFDLRFSHLYDGLVRAGADILSAPAAFTHTSGSAHWHILVRSRAIEFGAPMIACCQGGTHAGNLHTYGHSLIVDAWGKILAEGPEQGEVSVIADIDTRYTQSVRQMIPKTRLCRSFRFQK